MKRLTFLVALLMLCAASAFAQALATGELVWQGDGVTPQKSGQATNDHLFTRNTYDGVTYYNYVKFNPGETQIVWLWLDDDEIYQNEKVQALTPIPYNSYGNLYNEITYNSCQFDLYLPNGVSLTKIVDENGRQQIGVYGDRMPYTTSYNWAKKERTIIIDGNEYNNYYVVIYNPNTYGTHFSGRNAAMYQQMGALKKDDAPLLGLYMTCTTSGELPDIIIANQWFSFREANIAEWDANRSSFIYATGGNLEEQLFAYYNRVKIRSHGIELDKHTERILPGQQFTLHISTFPAGIEYAVTSSNPEVAQVSVAGDSILVTGISEGKATITVTPTDGMGVPATCDVTVYTTLGDVDRNGVINITDVTALIDMMLGYATYPTANADIYTDGVINIGDVVGLIDYLLKGYWPNPTIEQVIPQEYLDNVKQYMPIYNGRTPPVIEGVYLISPNTLLYSTHGFSPGHVFMDYYDSFMNQDMVRNIVDFKYSSRTGTDYGSQYESVVQGCDSTFTVFFKVTGTSVYYSYDLDYEMIRIYSGTIEEGGIRNLYHGFVMLSKSNDPYGYIVPVGTVRVFRDGDGWSEATSWPFSKGFNAMPFAIDGSLKSDISMPD